MFVRIKSGEQEIVRSVLSAPDIRCLLEHIVEQNQAVIEVNCMIAKLLMTMPVERDADERSVI